MHKDNNTALFEDIKQGDLAAFEALFRDTFTQLMNFASKITNNPEVSEEIVQDAFVYLWEKKSNIYIKTSVDNYLYAAVKNKCFNYLKLEKPKLTVQTSIEELKQEISESEIKKPSPKLAGYIADSISQLPEKCKEIFVLSRYGGLTYEEISEELSISKKTVEAQMSIALKKLRVQLKPILLRLND